MELTIIDKTNTTSYGVRSVSVNKRNALFGFSKRTTADFGWTGGNTIVFAQQKDNPKKWFIATSEGDTKDSFILKPDQKGGLLIQSRGLAKTIVNSIDESVESVKFLIGKSPIDKDADIKFFPLIPISSKEK